MSFPGQPSHSDHFQPSLESLEVGNEAHMDKPSDLLNQLLAQPPTEIEAWLRQSDVPADFNWLGLAEVAGFEAMRGEPATDLAWARLAVSTRLRLADMMSTDAQRRQQIISAMRLRTEMIGRYGVVAGDGLLDAAEIVRCFLDRHVGDYDDAVTDAARWRDLPTSRILELRLIKHELGAIRRLIDFVPATSTELQPWLELSSRLP
ncbi:hypothetical protein ACIA8C_11605 [Nocardia sp. NPDC051321]|uniref:hypothetical protein n=1 Tax=Nocardia sp. NPDC051321 TaxID=3364323 RepID=UPI0037BBF661